MSPQNSERPLVAAVLVLFSFLSTASIVCSQNGSNVRRQGPTLSATRVTRSREITSIVREIDARNIERTIRKLVSFGTRNTLSEQNNPNRGIGAARDWLFGEFLKAAAQSGGRMTVEKQTFEQAKAARVPQPTMLTS